MIKKIFAPKNKKVVMITLVVFILITLIIGGSVLYGGEIKEGIFEYFSVMPVDMSEIEEKKFTPPREKSIRDVEPEMLYERQTSKPQTKYGQVGQQITNNISLGYPNDNDMHTQFPSEFQMSDKIYLHNMNQYLPQQDPQSIYGGNRLSETQNGLQQTIPVQRLAM